ncbi:TMEM165/GDT1 family protein [Alcaligenes endophyticus]|uniref:GDT1 family protein n=1 Tax=Alcaligenes endophyticus TaxID=1929088 RepID=A0ABT8EI12_9BURK|nr:TMEM165/GDT1 family protein [Alcaligenes endophyticus]MCX5592739.1 TMEM165/GDT1 family protein [Alcaligenes endophyticus]MDN4120927.1 TMEM165/GDT1 family protein [Alcaligenes endophyticus]
MEALLVSTGIVALAEIGDKTQLLAFMLAARYRRPGIIILAILLATTLNHGLAGAIGTWLPALMDPAIMRWVLGIGFLVMAIWIMIPDKLDDTEATHTRFGVFGTTFVTFFIAEMGDKTQIATVALAAQYHAFFSVVIGTTLGMMIANVPAVIFGEKIADRVPTRLVHTVAACVFAVLGIYTLLEGTALLGL